MRIVILALAVCMFARAQSNSFPPSGGSLTGVTCNGSGCTFTNPVSISDTLLPISNWIDLKKHGAVCNGVTDDSAAMASALAAAYAAGGGTIIVPRGSGGCVMNSQIYIPNDNTAAGPGDGAYTRQPYIRLTGFGGDVRNGQGQVPGATYGGSMLVLKYTGSNAKIVTYGLGMLEIDHLTLYANTTSEDETPFLLTTGTTLNIHDNSFIGATAGVGASQDVIILGGTSPPAGAFTGLNNPDAPFQGYDTLITNNYFTRTRRALYAKTYVAGTTFSENFIGPGTGSNLADGAAIEFDGHWTGDNNVSNKITNNRCQISNYTYCAKFITSRNNFIAGNDVEDANQAFNLAYYHFDANSQYNLVLINVAANTGGITAATHVIDVSGANTVIDCTQGAYSVIGPLAGRISMNNPFMTGTVTAGVASAATAGANYSAAPIRLAGNYWNGSASAQDLWSLNNYMGSGTNPTAQLSFEHSGSSGTASIKFNAQTLFGSSSNGFSAAGDLTANGNVSMGSGAVFISSGGINNSVFTGRNSGDTMTFNGRTTVGGGVSAFKFTNGSQLVGWGGINFSDLGTPAKGNMVYCNDCSVATPCTSGGTGAWAFRTAAPAWACPF